MNEKILKKAEERAKNNKFLLTYIRKMLWHFGNIELFTKENKIIGIDKANNILVINLDDDKTEVSLTKNNIKSKIELQGDEIIIQSDIIEKEKRKNNAICKEFSSTKLYFNPNGNLKCSDNWEALITYYPKKEPVVSKIQQITFYKNDKAYQQNLINNKKCIKIIRNENINLNDYLEDMDNSSNYFDVLDCIIEKVKLENNKTDMIFEKEIKEKTKKLKF